MFANIEAFTPLRKEIAMFRGIHQTYDMAARRRAIFLLGCLLLPALTAGATQIDPSTDAQGLPPIRANGALVTLPHRWIRVHSSDANYILQPIVVPWKEIVAFQISVFEPGPKDLRAHMDATLEQLTKDGMTNVTIEEPVKAFTLPAGYDALAVVVSADQPGGGKIFARFTEVDAGDGGSQNFALVASKRELLDQHLPTYRQIVGGARLLSRVKLADAGAGAAGEKPLTLLAVEQVTDFLAWLLDVPFTPQQQQTIRDYLIHVWRHGQPKDLAGIRQVQTTMNQVQALGKEQRALARETLRLNALGAMRQDAQKGDTLAKMLVEAYDAANQPLAQGAAGEPPLTRQTADAALELAYFMASKVADPQGNAPDVRPTLKQLDDWARELVAGYADMPAARKQELAQMPRTYAALRLAWPEIPPSERPAVLERWAQTEPVRQAVEQIRKKGTPEYRRMREAFKGTDYATQWIKQNAYDLTNYSAYGSW
jgi:hypothetical protein